MINYDKGQRIRQLQIQNQRLRQRINQYSQSNRNSQFSNKNTGIDFQTKYKKALKQIYQVIQANKQLKQQLDKLKTSRNKQDSSMSEVRKQQFYKVYDSVLREKNQLANINLALQMEKQKLETQLSNLQAQINILRNDKLSIAQQKQALQLNSQNKSTTSYKPSQFGNLRNQQEFQQLQYKLKEKQSQFHRTLDNYQQHHLNLTRQNKKAEERIEQLEQKILLNEKQWKDRLQGKQIQSKQIRTAVRHQYQDQINNLRKEVNSLKHLNTQLMTKLQTNQLDFQNNYGNEVTQYELDMLNSIKELRIQMQPMKRQIIQLQQMNSFQKQQTQRQKTSLQMKVYQLEGDIQRYKILLKNQQDKILNMSNQIKMHQDNQNIIKKLEEENRIIGGRLIVLESKEIVSGQNRREPAQNKLQQKVLQFQNRVQLLLNDKQNISNLKNVTIHQLISLKSYIVQMDQKLKCASNQNQYAVKKYKSYKQKYLNLTKQLKQYQVTVNSLKSKILGYDKLVQRLQSQLQKNVNINQVQIININSKSTSQLSQVQIFKRKYQSLKQKLTLQQKYNKQQIQTLKLDYQAKIVDLVMKNDQIINIRSTINNYRQKNDQLTNKLTIKQNQLLDLRLQMGKQSSLQSNNSYLPNKQIITNLQQTIQRQQKNIFKLQSQNRQLQDNYRKRIMNLERDLQDSQLQIGKQKLSSSSRYTNEKSIDQLSSQNKKLRNKISQLEHQIILSKNQYNYSSNNQEMQFKLSSVQMEKNQLMYKLQSQTAAKKRLDKQILELVTKNNQMDSEITQLNIQNNRKIQDLKSQINQKQIKIQNLQDQIKRLRNQQHSNYLKSMDSSSVLANSMARGDDNSTMYQIKIQRLQKRIKELQFDNQQIRKKPNNISSFAVNSSYNYQVQSLKQQKQQARIKIQRLDRQITGLKASITTLQEQIYDKNRQFNQLKSQLSEQKLKFHDQIFDKDRIIAQLKSRIQYSQSNSTGMTSLQIQFDQKISDKQRQINNLRGKIISLQGTIQQLNSQINKYTIQISSLKNQSNSSNSAYIQHMQQSLQQKQRLILRFREQNNKLSDQLNEKSQQVSYKDQQLMKIQRQLQEYREYQTQVQRLKYSLNDRENLLSKNKFDIISFEQQNQRIKRQNSYMKDQLQKIKYSLIQKDDQISRLQLQINSVKIKITNQLKLQFTEQLYQKDQQITKLNFQIQSLKQNYTNLQNQFNQSQNRERKLQNDLLFVKNDLTRYQQQINQLNQKIYKRQHQFNQANNELYSMKFLQEQLNQKNNQINKLKSQLMEIKINTSHYEEQLIFKDSTYNRLLNQNQYLKQQLIEKDQTINNKQEQIRRLNNQLLSARANLEENIYLINQKEINISKLNAQLNRIKNQSKDLQEQIQERQQQWSNLSYQLNQAKHQIQMISDQISSKDITLSKIQNQNTFLKQQVTRFNQQVVQKNHQINRINQIVFTQKMQFTQTLTQQKQPLQRQIFSFKRQVQSLNHTIQDLQLQMRRLRIQNQSSRIKTETRNQTYIYTQEDLQGLRQENNKKYREIMRLELEISEKQSQCQSLKSKINKLQNLMKLIQSENQDDRNRLQKQIQSFISKERQYKQQIQQLSYHRTQGSQSSSQHISQINHNHNLSNNEEQLKFGLHLYTQQTDRLNKIIQELNQQLTALKLKLTAMTNQEDRVQENLITMVMTFAQVQALRSRLQKKDGQINEVRKSFIKSIVSANDQGINQSIKKITNMTENQSMIMRTQDSSTPNKISFLNLNAKNFAQTINKVYDYEIQEQHEQETTRLNRSGIEQLNSLKENNNFDDKQQTFSVIHSENQQSIQQQQVVNTVRDVSSATSSQMQYNFQLNTSAPQPQQVINSHQSQQRISINYQPQIGGNTLIQVPSQQQISTQSQGLTRVVSQSHYQSSSNLNARSFPTNSVVQVVGQNRQIINQTQSISQVNSSQRIIINPQSQQISQIPQGTRIISQQATQLRY